MNVARSLVVLAGLVGALGTGCVARVHGHAHVVTRDVVWVEPPPLVYVDGVYVVQDHDVAVYYVDGYYWYETDGAWYRRVYYDDPWVSVHASFVPVVVVHRDHRHYAHYHGSGQIYREPARPNRRGGSGSAHASVGAKPERVDASATVRETRHERGASARVDRPAESRPAAERPSADRSSADRGADRGASDNAIERPARSERPDSDSVERADKAPLPNGGSSPINKGGKPEDGPSSRASAPDVASDRAPQKKAKSAERPSSAPTASTPAKSTKKAKPKAKPRKSTTSR